MPLKLKLETTLDAIRQSLAADRLAHAYLLVGDPRASAGQFAEAILTLLYCSAASQRPCGICKSCRRIAQHSHPDMLWIEPQQRSRSIQKEQIQQVQQHISQTSLEGGWKTVVLVHAERLSDIAANKLLKTIEEPPPRCLFLLLSGNPEFLLPTITSRCQRIALLGESWAQDDPDKAAVEQIMTSHPAPGIMAGVVRAKLLQDLLKTIKTQVEADEHSKSKTEILDKLGKTAASEQPQQSGYDPSILKEMQDAIQARIEGKYRERRDAVLSWLLFWQRDLLCCICGQELATLYFQKESAQIHKQAARLTYRQALNNIRIVQEMKDLLEQALPEAVVLERGMIALNPSRAEQSVPE